MQYGYLNYASFGVRALATLIDSVLLALLMTPLLYWLYGNAYFTDESYFLGFWDFVIETIIPFAIIVLFWASRSATPGKALCNLKIVDEKTLRPISFRSSVIRYLAYYASTLPLGLGFFWVLLNKRRQGWHDILAKTLVIRASK